MIRLLLLLPLLAVPARAESADTIQHVLLAASLFGETVGEVRLTRRPGPTTTLTYRSDLLVVRDRLRLRQQAFIESTFDSESGRLVQSVARRCTGPVDGSTAPVCTPRRQLAGIDAAPALAVESLLAQVADGGRRCVATVDEETAIVGQSCAVGVHRDGGVDLEGTKLGVPFKARVEDELLVSLDFPQQGARFIRVTGPVEVSDEDLYAEPIPSSGDARAAIQRGVLRVRLFGPAEPLKALRLIAAPGQRIVSGDAWSLLVEVRQATPGRDAATQQLLDKVALVVAKASGSHADCQAATAWFLAEARQHHWVVRPATGLAYVDGRFAYHAWAIVETPGGAVPVDPLLAQVPADAGHIELATPGESAGTVLVSFHGELSISVE